jgi:crotonobetainyl-CoA:carnitine CoA-transferase CaiB-like acyl-CoA transferase
MTTAPRLPVEAVGVACVRAALEAAARLGEARTGEAVRTDLDHDQVRAALVSERLFRVDGAPAPAGFAPQSRFWRAGDGWVRTHANFPWHHQALLRAVGAPDDAALEAAIAARPAKRIEADVFAAGGVAAAVRTPAEWRAEPAGAAVASEPLVDRVRLGDADPRPSLRRDLCRHGAHNQHRKPVDDPGAALRCALSSDTTDFAQRSGLEEGRAALRSEFSGHGTDKPRRDRGDDAQLPAAGVRVLDLTRVIAGPICSRYLGALGADVLRLDPPHLPDLEPGAPADTLLGKRSAFLDLRNEAGARRLEDLLAGADVVLLGYRPGALAGFGLAPEELAERHPGLVIAQLSAWGFTGPWAERRGFDSIVQAASGIASLEADADGTPGALPCQLLDHGTGYLTAAAVLDALAEQRQAGGTHLARLSLARTAHWLVEGGPDVPLRSAPGADALPSADPPWHEPGAAFVAPVPANPALEAVPPPGALAGAPLRWSRAARYGADDPAWSRRTA